MLPDATDVLVVGAGPTGLMLALQLARRGVRPLVVDRAEGPSTETKALGVHARTLEIYDRLGLAESAIARGLPAAGANMWAGARHAARIPLGDIGGDLSPFPYMLVLGQDQNERLLGEALRAHGVPVHWRTELVGLRDAERARGDADAGVHAELETADGTRRAVRARWVAGCDGAHSAVRRLRGLAFVGAAYEHVFFVADTETAGPMVPDEINVVLRRRTFHAFFPLRGRDHWRVVGLLPDELVGRDGVTFEDLRPTIERVSEGRVAVRSCAWFSTYRIHHRRADRFRDGRCLLLGDAAHVHSPVGAQGMNTGLQDATNLAWKLALVLQGAADERLVDSYAAEREPVADRLLQTTDQAFSVVVSDSLPARLVRLHVAPRLIALLMRRESARRVVFRTVSQIGITYRDGPLARASGGASGASGASSGVSAAAALATSSGDGPRAGDRFPWMRVRVGPDARPADGAAPDGLYAHLDDTRFTLLSFGDAPRPELPPALAGRTDRLAVPDDEPNRAECARVGVRVPSAWLLRPDGHVALAGAPLTDAALADWSRERLRALAGGDVSAAPPHP